MINKKDMQSSEIDSVRVGTCHDTPIQVTIEKYIFNILFAFHLLMDYVSD